MMKRMAVLILTVLALSLTATAPVNAMQPIRGDMELHFNLGFDPALQPPSGCSEFTWVGNVKPDGAEYGMVFIPTGRVDTGKVFHFDEIWRVYEGTIDFTGGVFNCDDLGKVVMTGTDSGVSQRNLKATANGQIDLVEEPGPFEGLTGRRVHWNGVIDESTMLDFSGPFRIN
jgi:hypothetical protein